MSDDAKHGAAAIVAIGSLCGGCWLWIGPGAALMLFGTVLLAGVVYARTRIESEAPDESQP